MLLKNDVEVRRGADVDGATNDVIVGCNKCRATWDKRENMKVLCSGEGCLVRLDSFFEIEITEERIEREVHCKITTATGMRSGSPACLARCVVAALVPAIAVH